MTRVLGPELSAIAGIGLARFVLALFVLALFVLALKERGRHGSVT